MDTTEYNTALFSSETSFPTTPAFDDTMGNASDVAETTGIRYEDILSADVMNIVSIVFYYIIQIPVLAFGIGTNVFNILIFRISGMKDSVSITFTALSISDLGYATFFFTIRMNTLLNHKFNVESWINLSWLSYYLSFYGVFFQDTSVVITVFLAIQKCCCVAIPHLFKNVFSPGRTIAILACLSLGVLSAYLPMILNMKFVASPALPLSNQTAKTQIIVTTNPMFFKALDFWHVFNKIVLPASSHAITIGCLIVMAIKLKKSAKFRTSMDVNPDTAGDSKTSKSSIKLSYKERRVLTCGALVSAVFVISATPASVLSYVKLIAPSFFSDPRYVSIKRLLNNCQNIPIHVSASINVFIYMKYNSKYRESAVGLFNKCFPIAKCLHEKAQA